MISATRITSWRRAGESSRLDDRLARNPSPGRLPAEPAVDGRSDIGELTLVDPARGVLAGDIGEQKGVLAGMVRRQGRGIAPVIRGEDEEVTRPKGGEEVGQPPIEILQAAMEVHGIVAVTPE